MRVKPDRAVWVPADAVPTYTAHAAWTETVSFDDALEHYGARAVTDRSAGPGTRWFHLQLSSGRYACIECRRDHPQTVVISLEVETSGANASSGGWSSSATSKRSCGRWAARSNDPGGNSHRLEQQRMRCARVEHLRASCSAGADHATRARPRCSCETASCGTFDSTPGR